MRALLQRVSEASVEVGGTVAGAIRQGLLVLAGIAKGDTESDADYLADKLVHLRIFADIEGKLNRSVLDVGGGVLIVSQFTLYADCHKGRRPSFELAAAPDEARRLYQYLVRSVEKSGVSVATGVFQADMKVSLVNDGPVTIILESRKVKP